MSTVQIRLEIDNYLNQVDDSFLKVVHAMLTTYAKEQETQKKEPVIFSYDIEGNPKYAHEMKAIYDKQVKAAIEEGAYKTLEDLEKEMETW